MINKYFKSIVDQTEEPIVICDLDFKIFIWMIMQSQTIIKTWLEKV